MKLFSKEKPIYWKIQFLVTEFKVLGILVFPWVPGLLLSTFLLKNTNWGSPWCVICGFLPGLALSFLTLPGWFVKPTSAPSPWQRFCRDYILGAAQHLSFLCSKNGDSIQTRDIRFFQYYLSHPQKPENVWADQIDTTQFDWQNPKEWPL